MDTSDSEAFESADENFENENVTVQEKKSNKSTSNTKESETVVSTNVEFGNQIDNISNLLDNLEIKFDDIESESDLLGKCSSNVNETSKLSATRAEKPSGWDDEAIKKNLNEITSSEILDVKENIFEDKEFELWGQNLYDEIEKEKKLGRNIWGESDEFHTQNLFDGKEKEVGRSIWGDSSNEFCAQNLFDDVANELTIENLLEDITDARSDFNLENSTGNEFTVKSLLEDITESRSDHDLESSTTTKFSTKNLPKDKQKSSGSDKNSMKQENILESSTTNIFSVKSNLDNMEESSGWDNDVDWTPIENNDKIEEPTGWDDFDTWDTIEDAKTTPQHQHQEEKSWSSGVVGGGWSSWGVTSLLTSASEGVSTFTSQVSQGLTTVLESSIGVPSPEELAKAQKLEREKTSSIEEKKEEEEAVQPPFSIITSPSHSELSGGGGVFGLGNLLTGVTHITKLVETTSSKVVNTGLDTLETIGKKTMEVLQDGDPGLIKKRALLGLNPDKPCLSQVLREAKEKAAAEDVEIKQQLQEQHERSTQINKKVHFETLFDDYHGLVHLEALEMLSKQCDIKLCTTVESMADGSKELEEFQETMVQIKELCELPDEEEDDQQLTELQTKLTSVVNELGLQQQSISFTKLLDCWTEAEEDMKLITDVYQIHRMGIETLAKITSIAVEQFHKCAELLLIKERRSTADEADTLVQLTTILTALIGIVAAKYSEKLDSLSSSIDDNNSELNGLITNIFFEATQSSSYVQDAFQLFIPILQIGAV